MGSRGASKAHHGRVCPSDVLLVTAKLIHALDLLPFLLCWKTPIFQRELAKNPS